MPPSSTFLISSATEFDSAFLRSWETVSVRTSIFRRFRFDRDPERKLAEARARPANVAGIWKTKAVLTFEAAKRIGSFETTGKARYTASNATASEVDATKVAVAA